MTNDEINNINYTGKILIGDVHELSEIYIKENT